MTALQTLATSLLHWRAGSSIPFAAIRKEAGHFCGSSLRKGKALAYIGKNQNPKDLKILGLFCGSFLRKGEVFSCAVLFQNFKDLYFDKEQYSDTCTTPLKLFCLVEVRSTEPPGVRPAMVGLDQE